MKIAIVVILSGVCFLSFLSIIIVVRLFFCCFCFCFCCSVSILVRGDRSISLFSREDRSFASVIFVVECKSWRTNSSFWGGLTV